MELFYILFIQSYEALKPITHFRMLPKKNLEESTLQNNIVVVWVLVTAVFMR
jgi:hypothetical protein